MSNIFHELRSLMTVPTDPFPDEAYKACIPNVDIPIEGTITSGEMAAEALLAGEPLLGCKVLGGAKVQIGDIDVLRGKTILHLNLDRYRNLHLVSIENTDGDISEEAKRFFWSHDLVISDIHNKIKLDNVHYSKTNNVTELQAILR